MPTIKYTLSSRSCAGKSEVLVRFYAGKEFSQRAKSHILVPREAWDKKAGDILIPRKVSLHTQELFLLQKQLVSLRDTIFRSWWDIQEDAPEGWLQSVIDADAGHCKPQERMTVAELVRLCAASKKIRPTTEEQYEVVARALERYGSKNGYLYCDNFKPAHVEKFVDFFRKETVTRRNGKGTRIVQRGHNTIVTKLKRLASACNFGVRKGYMPDTPFGKAEDGKYDIPTEIYGTPICLSIAERDAVQNMDFGRDEYNLYRDIFIFQCHVGCRISDLYSFTKKNITDDGFLQYIQEKTITMDPITVRVPLDAAALDAISRYDCPDGRLFPFALQDRYNEVLHIICRMAGLTRTVLVIDPVTEHTVQKELWEVCTSHIARKTFMQHIFRQTKDTYITSSFTGHSPNTKVFARYATVDDDIKLEIINKAQAASVGDNAAPGTDENLSAN